MPDTTLTWLGHAAFRVDTADGKRIYVDPFLNGNPKTPAGELTPDRVDIIAVTRHNKTLDMGNYRKAAEEGNFFLRGFNYLFILKKPAQKK